MRPSAPMTGTIPHSGHGSCLFSSLAVQRRTKIHRRRSTFCFAEAASPTRCVVAQSPRLLPSRGAGPILLHPVLAERATLRIRSG